MDNTLNSQELLHIWSIGVSVVSEYLGNMDPITGKKSYTKHVHTPSL